MQKKQLTTDPRNTRPNFEFCGMHTNGAIRKSHFLEICLECVLMIGYTQTGGQWDGCQWVLCGHTLWPGWQPNATVTSGMAKKKSWTDTERDGVCSWETWEASKAAWITLRQEIDPAWKSWDSWHGGINEAQTHAQIDSTDRRSSLSIQVSNGLMASSSLALED